MWAFEDWARYEIQWESYTPTSAEIKDLTDRVKEWTYTLQPNDITKIFYLFKLSQQFLQ